MDRAIAANLTRTEGKTGARGTAGEGEIARTWRRIVPIAFELPSKKGTYTLPCVGIHSY